MSEKRLYTLLWPGPQFGFEATEEEVEDIVWGLSEGSPVRIRDAWFRIPEGSIFSVALQSDVPQRRETQLAVPAHLKVRPS